MTGADLNYRPDIDGLRAVAVLAVVLHHLSAPLLPGGYVGVDVFFVISGYLITRIISREMEEGNFTFARFYERRARRIFPALFAVLAISVVAGYALLLPSDMTATLRGALGTVFFASNVVFWRDFKEGYFAATDAALNPLLHTWSLAVEEQFYVFFPVLLLACYRWTRRYIVFVLTACALVSLAGAALLVHSKSVAVFFLSPFRAWELLVGALLAVGAVPPLRSRVLREALAGAGLVAIAVACVVYDDKTTFPGLTALVPVLGAAALIYAGGIGPTATGRLLQLPPMVWVGLVSYSLYLWHWPVIVYTRYAIGFEPITSYIPLLFIVSLGLAALSYRFIEQPFRRGANFSGRAVFVSSAVFVSALSLLATVGLRQEGFAGRFGEEVVELDKARTPEIPWKSCNARVQEAWCSLGDTDRSPTMLLWGDSHLLSWAPALNKSLEGQGVRAVFVTSSACPPLLGVATSTRPGCAGQNLGVKSYLASSPSVHTVVLAAYWSFYFSENDELTSTADYPLAHGSDAAKAGLISTIQWLRDNGKQVVLIGPVPVFEKNVPLALALGNATDRSLLRSSLDEQITKTALFFEAVNTVKLSGVSFRLFDPIQWLCSEDCMVVKDGIPLYRDSHHLSIAGAMALEPYLATALAPQRQPHPTGPAESGNDSALKSTATRSVARSPRGLGRCHVPLADRRYRPSHMLGCWPVESKAMREISSSFGRYRPFKRWDFVAVASNA